MDGRNSGALSLGKRWLWLLTVVQLLTVSCQEAAERTYRIMALGDSNGAAKDGWAVQLQKSMPRDSVYNVSVPGNTLGFDNLDNPRLNSLRNLEAYLKAATTKDGALDLAVILLGTNDSKAVFHGREGEVLSNLRKVVKTIASYPYKQGNAPDIIIVSPPPYGPDSILAPKYKGGSQRVAYLAEQYEKIAAELQCGFVDAHSLLKNDFGERSKDGVHLDSIGQRRIAKAIKKAWIGRHERP